MNALVASVLLSRVVLAASPAYLLFGETGTDWVLMSNEGEVLLRTREVGGVRPIDAATSPDGKRWAVSTRRERQKPELLLFPSLDAAPRRIVSQGDVLDGLRFSEDGEWVYYSSNDDKQPTFENQPMRYAQVYRVRFKEGRPERLTLSKGCHMWPQPLTRTKVVVSHATCVGGRSLELLTVKSGAEEMLLPPSANVGETAPHPDGKTILFTQSVPAGTEFRTWHLAEGRSSLWLTTPVASLRTRPQWAERGRAVLFQNNNRVWRTDATGSMTQVLDLEGRP